MEAPHSDKLGQEDTSFWEMNFFAPVLRVPIGNQINTLLNRQLSHNKFCADVEALLANCLEQYGLSGGRKKCQGYYVDLKECHTRTYEGLRFNAMKAERQRQFRAGEREKEHDPAPPLDAF